MRRIVIPVTKTNMKRSGLEEKEAVSADAYAPDTPAARVIDS